MIRRTLRGGRRRLERLLLRIQNKQIVHFLHIGKTGGTAVKYAVRHYATGSHYKLFLHPHGVTLKDVPQGDAVVFFLRDPISRFVSGFYSRQRQGRPRYFTQWSPEEQTAFEEFSTPEQLAAALDSTDPVKKGRAESAMRSIEHVRDSFWRWFESESYFRSRLSDVFFVGSQECLAEDFSILKSRLGLPDTAVLPDDDVIAHRNPGDLDRTLGDEAIASLERWYEDDYQFMQLCKELIAEENLGYALRGAGDEAQDRCPRANESHV
jgi:hypothetical protein